MVFFKDRRAFVSPRLSSGIAIGEYFSVLPGTRTIHYRRASYLSFLSQLERYFALPVITGALLFSPLLCKAQSSESTLQQLTVARTGVARRL